MSEIDKIYDLSKAGGENELLAQYIIIGSKYDRDALSFYIAGHLVRCMLNHGKRPVYGMWMRYGDGDNPISNKSQGMRYSFLLKLEGDSVIVQLKKFGRSRGVGVGGVKEKVTNKELHELNDWENKSYVGLKTMENIIKRMCQQDRAKMIFRQCFEGAFDEK